MFYSEKQFVEACTATTLPYFSSGDVGLIHRMRNRGAAKAEYAKLFREVKKAIIERQHYIVIDNRDEGISGQTYTGKFFRPWDVVPHLRDWRPPEGEFGVGIEVEMGFNTREACQNMMRKIANWRHIAIDEEGGSWPAEVTFPPVLYSKFNGQSQACRYLKLLAKEDSGVHHHHQDNLVGTHVNVSYGGAVPVYIDARRRQVVDSVRVLSRNDNIKYFGRRPYGYIYPRDKFFEFKLFNSTTDWKRLRQYVDIAVSLTELMISNVPVTDDSVHEALERGYNKRQA